MALDRDILDERASRQERIEAQREADREASFEDEEREAQRQEEAQMRMMRLKSEQEAKARAEEEMSTVSLSAYAPALIIAGFKDLLDLVGVGSLPAIGTLVTFLVGILILFTLYLGKNVSSRPKGVFLIQTAPLFFGGVLVEGLLFGLNFLPFTVALVVAIYRRELFLATEKSVGVVKK
jgi:Flp pilus assembly protein TadB